MEDKYYKPKIEFERKIKLKAKNEKELAKIVKEEFEDLFLHNPIGKLYEIRISPQEIIKKNTE